MALMAHAGLARAVVPSHTPFDGDLVFAAATGRKALQNPAFDLMAAGHAAAVCLTRAIARGVYSATPANGDPKPTWSERFA
jgi:D-aminopeptidase